MRYIAVRTGLIISLSLLCLLSLDIWYRRQYLLDYDPPQNLLPAAEIVEKYQIVKVGNSHAQDGVTFDGYNLKSLDLSGAAQKYETDLALLKHYARQIENGAVVLIPVTPISFSHTKPKNDLGFQAMYYGRISPIFIPNLNIGQYLEHEFLPFMRVGYNLRQKNRDQIRERISREEKGEKAEKDTHTQPKAPTRTVEPASRTGLATPSAVLSTMKPEPFSDNVHFVYMKWLHTDEFSQTSFATNRRDLEKLIRYAQSQGWQPVLIRIPISEKLSKALPAHYEQEYVVSNLASTNLHGLEIVSLVENDLISRNLNLYHDSDHLNQYGRTIYSYYILQILIEKGYLPATANGYLN